MQKKVAESENQSVPMSPHTGGLRVADPQPGMCPAPACSPRPWKAGVRGSLTQLPSVPRTEWELAVPRKASSQAPLRAASDNRSRPVGPAVPHTARHVLQWETVPSHSHHAVLEIELGGLAL